MKKKLKAKVHLSIMKVHLLKVCHADLGFLQTNTQTRICLKEECHIHLITWGWVNHGLIFIFGKKIMHFKNDNNNDKCRLSFNVNQQKLFKRKK